jgi:hypothetical protein
MQKCVTLFYCLLPNGKKCIDNHFKDYGEILLHVLCSEVITEPLIALLQYMDKNAEVIELYCKMIELMWINGDESVVNVVEVTILERLSDDRELWESFGNYLSNDFKQYINNNILSTNLMMAGVNRL